MFDRAPTFHVGAHIFGLRIFCTRAVSSWTQNNLCMAQLLLGLRIFHERRHFSIDADILGRRHFAQGADILPRAPTFQGTDILHRAPTFCIGRRHFTWGANILMENIILCIVGKSQYLISFAVSLPVYFEISFCLIFTADICVYFSIYLCMLCAPTFLAQLF